MIGRQQGIGRQLRQHAFLDRRIQPDIIGQRQFGLAIAEAAIDLGQVGFEQGDGDLGMAQAKAAQQPRCVVRAQILETDQAQGAAHRGLLFASATDRRRQVEHLPRLLQ
ncbi:hypothetical protein D3C76_1343680 [compost metagenome]